MTQQLIKSAFCSCQRFHVQFLGPTLGSSQASDVLFWPPQTVLYMECKVTDTYTQKLKKRPQPKDIELF